MADPGAPSVDFVVAAGELSELKALIREQVPDSLIGTKDVGDGRTYVTVTGFSRTPQAEGALREIAEGLRDKADLSGERPADTPLADLIAKVRRAQDER